jgi:hypothetical protein
MYDRLYLDRNERLLALAHGLFGGCYTCDEKEERCPGVQWENKSNGCRSFRRS